MMKTEHNIRMTAAEIGSLWTQYMSDSMAICTIKYFIEKTEDSQVLPVLQNALNLAHSHVQQIADFFYQESFPVPIGFNDSDVTLTAPRLYSDPFHLNYIKNMSKTGMNAYSLSLSLASRADIRKFILQSLKTAADLDEMATRVMLSKGLYVRPPYITASNKAEYIQSTDYLGSFFGGNGRRLSAIEITHLFLNAQSNSIGKALVIGFSQVAQSMELRKLFLRSVGIAEKHIDIFTATLNECQIPGPMILDSDVMGSTVPPFSDKLMLFHLLALMNTGFSYYAAALSTSLRLDISVDYVRLAAEVEKLGYDAIRVMINNGWAEEPPMAVDRIKLVLAYSQNQQAGDIHPS